MSTRYLDAIFWILVAACATAQIFILRAVFRISPRNPTAGRTASVDGGGASTSGDSDADCANTHGVPTPHRSTEILWVLLPVVLLVLAFFLAWRAMHPSFADFLKRNGSAIGLPSASAASR